MARHPANETTARPVGSFVLVILLSFAAIWLPLVGIADRALADRVGFGIIFALAASYAWLEEVEPALHCRLRVEGGLVYPTRRSHLVALQGRSPSPFALREIRIDEIRWIPADRIPSHCFVLTIAPKSGRRFKVDNRKDAEQTLALIEGLAAEGQVESFPELMEARKFWNPETRRWNLRA